MQDHSTGPAVFITNFTLQNSDYLPSILAQALAHLAHISAHSLQQAFELFSHIFTQSRQVCSQRAQAAFQLGFFVSTIPAQTVHIDEQISQQAAHSGRSFLQHSIQSAHTAAHSRQCLAQLSSALRASAAPIEIPPALNATTAAIAPSIEFKAIRRFMICPLTIGAKKHFGTTVRIHKSALPDGICPGSGAPHHHGHPDTARC